MSNSRTSDHKRRDALSGAVAATPHGQMVNALHPTVTVRMPSSVVGRQAIRTRVFRPGLVRGGSAPGLTSQRRRAGRVDPS